MRNTLAETPRKLREQIKIQTSHQKRKIPTMRRRMNTLTHPQKMRTLMRRNRRKH